MANQSQKGSRKQEQVRSETRLMRRLLEHKVESRVHKHCGTPGQVLLGVKESMTVPTLGTTKPKGLNYLQNCPTGL